MRETKMITGKVCKLINESDMKIKTTKIVTSKLSIDRIVTNIGPVGAVSHGLPIYLRHAPFFILSGNLSPTVNALFKGHFSASKKFAITHV